MNTALIMQAITVTDYSTDGLVLQEYPIPQPNEYQVLIQVAAAGMNRADVMQRQGRYPPPIGASPILGLEVAGIVVAVGAKVEAFHIGDPVCALLSGGGYAQYCVAEAGTVLPIPHGYSFIQAAALPEACFTVWSNLFERAHLQAGETVLIQGGSSGIGTTAIQLATIFGAKVIATAGSDEKCERTKTLGAIAAINYQTDDFVAEIEKLTNGKGVDVILDIVGADYLPRHLRCLATDGRLAQIALQNGFKSEINLLTLVLKRLTITGSTLRPREIDFKSMIAQQLQQHLWPKLSSGAMLPVIDSVYSLAEANAAHRYMESGVHFGKIILTV